jgi:hypothetical protein
MKISVVFRMILASVAFASVLSSSAQVAHPSQTVSNNGPDVISRVTKVKGLKFAAASLQAPSDAFCRINFGSPCYSPQEIRNSYNL